MADERERLKQVRALTKVLRAYADVILARGRFDEAVREARRLGVTDAVISAGMDSVDMARRSHFEVESARSFKDLIRDGD